MNTQRRVLVTGSRNWPHRGRVYAALYREYAEHGSFIVVHGACSRGADAQASDWVRQHGVSLGVAEEMWPAQWHLHGRGAGPRRNAAMVASRPDRVLAFIYRNSPGASFTVRAAKGEGIPVRVEHPPPLR